MKDNIDTDAEVLVSRVMQFMRSNYIFWLEAMNLIGEMNHCAGMMWKLRQWLQVSSIHANLIHGN